MYFKIRYRESLNSADFFTNKIHTIRKTILNKDKNNSRWKFGKSNSVLKVNLGLRHFTSSSWGLRIPLFTWPRKTVKLVLKTLFRNKVFWENHCFTCEFHEKDDTYFSHFQSNSRCKKILNNNSLLNSIAKIDEITIT